MFFNLPAHNIYYNDIQKGFFMVENRNDAWAKEAAAIARQFVMALNGSMLYGCAHPNTAKNAVALCDTLGASFHGRGMITVILNNGVLMVEDWPLDRSFNTGKIVTHFEKLELTSISFEQGVTAESLMQLIGLVGDVNNIEMCKIGLAEAKRSGTIPRVRINYVIYGKMTADDLVIKDTPEARAAGIYPPNLPMPAAPAGASNISYGNLSAEAAAQIEQVLTLSSFLEKPKEVSAILAKTDTGRFQAGELHNAFGKIRSELDASSALNVDELLMSLHSMKKDLYEAIEVQKATGRVMRSAAVINKELNDLTARAIVKLVRDEYKSGKTPLNRLAHTIRRMIPSNAELMNFLPHLKEMLLAEGMGLSDYLELVRMLGLKIESEELSDSLKEAADSMGASVSDLVSAIRSNPEEAARLILLASEVRQGIGEEESGLSEALTNHIEQVCAKMAVDACASAGAAGGSGVLKKTLMQFESQMFAQLAGRQDVAQHVLQDVKQRLAARFNDVFAAANNSFASVNNSFASVSNSSAAAAPQRTGGAGPKTKMPPEALSASNLLFLVNKEIKRNQRYKSEFATVMVSIEKIIEYGGAARSPVLEDTPELLPQLFAYVEESLRDVDLIGALNADSSPELFILLPMTGEEGTAVVKEKINQTAGERVYTLAGRQVKIEVKVSAAFPNENAKDLKMYLAYARCIHKKVVGS